jgi:hypothetical protein
MRSRIRFIFMKPPLPFSWDLVIQGRADYGTDAPRIITPAAIGEAA